MMIPEKYSTFMLFTNILSIRVELVLLKRVGRVIVIEGEIEAVYMKMLTI
jgi:hypothetical protein